MKELVTSRPGLQELLKKILKAEKKWSLECKLNTHTKKERTSNSNYIIVKQYTNLYHSSHDWFKKESYKTIRIMEHIT